MRHELLEAIVEQDDAILHKYLQEHELTEEEIRKVLRQGHDRQRGRAGAVRRGIQDKGVQKLLDAVIDYLPSPLEVPPIQGHLPHHDATHAARPAARRRAVRGPGVQDHD